jgi:tetratricopeptide (TPR) repeat protein
MNRWHWILVAVLAGEVVLGTVLVYRAWSQPAPPAGDWSYVDPLTARHLQKLVRECQSPDDWWRLGQAYLACGYFGEAEACCRQAASLAPERPELVYDWAFALERLGHHTEANEQYERAIERGHANPDHCWFYIGRNWLRLENAAEARAAFVKAGQQPAARYEFARLLVRDGQWQEALVVLEQLAAAHPRAVQPSLLGYRIEVLRDGTRAGWYADRAARATDVLPSPWNDDFDRFQKLHSAMGAAGEWRTCQILVAQHKYAEAESRLHTALHLEWDPAGVDLLAKVAASRGQFHEAITHLQGVIDKHGPSLHFLTRLGDMYERAGQRDQAARAWSRALHLSFAAGAKGRDYQHRKLAAYYEKIGDQATARRHAALGHTLVGQEAFWTGDLKNAQIAFEKAVDWDPGLAHAWYYLGDTRRLLGQTATAREAYLRCLQINPDHGRALAGLELLDLAGP